MNPIKRLLAWLLAVALLLTLSGCYSDEIVHEPCAIAVCLPNQQDAFWAECAAQLQKAVTSVGNTLTVYDANDDDKQQAEQLKTAAAAGYRSILLASVDSNSAVLQETVNTLTGQGIKIIAFYTQLFNCEGLSAYITYDLMDAGKRAAATLVSELKLQTGAKATVELITTPLPDGITADHWYNGAMSVLRPYLKSGQLSIPSGQKNSGESATKDEAAAAARYRLLCEQYGAPDSVLCSSDLAAQGVMNAAAQLWAEGKEAKLPFLTGFGSLAKVNHAIAGGARMCTAYGEPSRLCASAAALAAAAYGGDLSLASDTVSYYNGKKIVPTCVVSTVAVNPDNYPSTLVANGRLDSVKDETTTAAETTTSVASETEPAATAVSEA